MTASAVQSVPAGSCEFLPNPYQHDEAGDCADFSHTAKYAAHG